MSVQVVTMQCAPFNANGNYTYTAPSVRNKKRKSEFRYQSGQPSPKRSFKIEQYREKTDRIGKPIAPIAPLQNKHFNDIQEDTFNSYLSISSDFINKLQPTESDMDMQKPSLLRNKLLSMDEHGVSSSSDSSRSATEKMSSSGSKFINPKKEFIVKHNKDTTNLRNNDLNMNQPPQNISNLSDSKPTFTKDFTTEYMQTFEEMKSNAIKMEDPQTGKVMSNIEFWKYLLTLQVLMQQASVQLKNMVTKPVEELVSHSLKLVELKNELEPHLGLLENSLRTILNVLPHVEYVEIGSPENTFKVSQQAWEKAYSKTTIKDSALAFLECDLFIPKQTKLSSTAGRSSNSAINGTLKPIDSRILNALYYTLADRKRMPNIQRTQDNYLASPHFLTAKEQKLVRETLAQYFNQLRQKEKRRSHMSIKKEDESY